MELKFDNIDEMITFLASIGYYITKAENVSKDDSEEENKGTKVDEDWWKKVTLPQTPNPYNPYNPYVPYYPNYPIVTYDAMSDPNLSSKFPKCSK